ncbi:MAG: YgiT-type zinc finger protein [Chloroflexota bacterium]
MSQVVTDLPFKLSETRIVILKELPVLQCEACREYLIEDPVMARIDTLLKGTDSTAELEVLRYAA